MRKLAYILGVNMMLWVMASPVAAQSGEVVCNPVRHCISILETHDADSFDYEVIRESLINHGPDGKQVLMMTAAGQDAKLSSRALGILSKGFKFSSSDLNLISNIWPRGDLESLTKILARYPNVVTRQVAIDTLSHRDADVRTAARELMIAYASRPIPERLTGKDFKKISEAISSEPTPALLGLVDEFDPNKTRELYARALKAEDADVVKTAYHMLYKRDKAQALNTLVDTLMSLREDEIAGAMAISHMLRDRHKNRKDGFYLQFASDVSKDIEMSPMGRATGFDAVIKSQNLPGVPAIQDTDIQRGNFIRVVSASDKVDPDYIFNFPKMAASNPDPWLNVLWSKLKGDTSQHKSDFIYQVGRYKTPRALKIVDEAQTDVNDWRVRAAAVQASGAQGNKARLVEFKAMAEKHPISAVRASAQMTLKALGKSGAVTRETLLTPIDAAQRKGPVELINRNANYCRAVPTPLAEAARALPYFDDMKLASGKATARYHLKTAESTNTGWLAGYDFGDQSGALIYFKDSGAGTVLLDAPIMAVIPVKRPPLGQIASSFWVITKSSNDMPRGGTLYKVTETPVGHDVIRHATLPNMPDYISVETSDDVFIAFKSPTRNPRHANPPLLLSPQGRLSRACDRPTQKASL